MNVKRILSALLCAVMLFGTLAVCASSAEKLPFTDVKNTKWFYDAIKAVYDAGFMNGKSDTKFEPNATMTRAELVVLLSRLADADVADKGQSLAFKDTKKNAWYADAVGWGVEAGLVNGYEGNTFKPNAPILRQIKGAEHAAPSTGEDVGPYSVYHVKERACHQHQPEGAAAQPFNSLFHDSPLQNWGQMLC